MSPEQTTIHLGELSRIEPKPDEFFVLHLAEHLEQAEIQVFTKYWESIHTKRVPLLILGPSVTLSVCAPSKEEHF